ncbi:alpha/beta hydrolase [Oceanobacillus halotolerans]|uniref:alpha/beta hydrolase n=1 Tax=Oceanobacillus halotolerans TaxID=2663380 RepID=UPI0013DD219F|nr:alpha/beta hydrolase [Oceanobacillus halotolerans]
MKRKIWWKIGIGIIILLFIINGIASFYFYTLAIERGPKDFLNGNEDLEVSAEAMSEFTEGTWRDWVGEQDFDEWEITSYDDLTLKGYYLEAKEPTNKTVILAHGYLGNAKQMGLYGQHYYEELGYNLLMPDARGHGQSGGDYIGFGWHDRLDYLDWIDQVIEKVGSDSEIILHGVSMGAATVLMTSGEDLPANVQAIVADSPYTNVKELFSYQLERMFHLPDFPVLPTTSLVTKLRAGYSLTEASALDQVKKAEVPILYIHGNDDTFVPTENAKTLYKHTGSEADLVLFDGSSHGEAFVIHQERYIEELTSFLQTYMK